jgi:hypothetical protein
MTRSAHRAHGQNGELRINPAAELRALRVPRPRRCGAGESVCRRGSVREVVADVSVGDHPSERPTRRCRNRSFGGRAAPSPTAWPCTGWGLPAATVARRTGALLPHRFTLACARRAGPSAVCSLLPCPRGRPRLSRLSILPCGAPTFLDRVRARRPCPAAVTRPTHQRDQCGAGWPGTQAGGLKPAWSQPLQIDRLTGSEGERTTNDDRSGDDVPRRAGVHRGASRLADPRRWCRPGAGARGGCGRQQHRHLVAGGRLRHRSRPGCGRWMEGGAVGVPPDPGNRHRPATWCRWVTGLTTGGLGVG